MEILIIILCAILLVSGLVSWLLSRFAPFKKTQEENQAPKEENSECCGKHLVCEKSERYMKSDIVYFDDEELDAYKGIAADAYDEKGLENFSEVFYSMREEDMEDWLHSLQLREIALPAALRDEALLIVSERRNTTQ